MSALQCQPLRLGRDPYGLEDYNYLMCNFRGLTSAGREWVVSVCGEWRPPGVSHCDVTWCALLTCSHCHCVSPSGVESRISPGARCMGSVFCIMVAWSISSREKWAKSWCISEIMRRKSGSIMLLLWMMPYLIESGHLGGRALRSEYFCY